MESMNTHLESTKEHAEERQAQLKRAFEMMAKTDCDVSIIFAGDLNLRDTEVC